MQTETGKLSVREKIGYSLGDGAANFIFQTFMERSNHREHGTKDKSFLLYICCWTRHFWDNDTKFIKGYRSSDDGTKRWIL